jgi:hypothetical protein
MRRIAIACSFLALVGCSSRAGGRMDACAPAAAAAAPAGASGPLRAGEIDDNEKFEDYLAYLKAYPHGDVPKLDVRDSRSLWVVDERGFSAPDVPVSVLADGRAVFRARTTANGTVLVPLRALGLPAPTALDLDVAGRRFSIDRFVGMVGLDDHAGVAPVTSLDVALCLDTTGSMGDEIDRLKRTLRDVTARVEEAAAGLHVRYGLVTYRDEGDAYVQRVSDFTSSVDQAERVLSRVEAAGGGDYPEAVNEALAAAVNDLSWKPEGAIRLLFLIGDAPPHLDRGTPWTTTVRGALERGVKVVSVAASGLDDTGEFVWRALAQMTLGRFVFLSYDGSTTHHVGGYDEDDLDEVLVRAVKREVDALPRNGRPQPGQRGHGREPTEFTTWAQIDR